MFASVMLKGLFTSSSRETTNPLVSFLKARRQGYKLALTCRCLDPINVGLILDLHLTSSTVEIISVFAGNYRILCKRPQANLLEGGSHD